MGGPNGLLNVPRAVLLVLLIVMSAAILPTAVKGEEGYTRCSRERSRRARKVLEDYLLPYVRAQPVNMSRECLFQPSKDMYLVHEDTKKEVRRSQWKCSHCNKIFRSEHFLDKHFDNRHMDLIPEGADVCLGDYCDVLHCSYDENKASEREYLYSCKQSDADRRRHHCEAIAHKCFPSDQDTDMARLHDFFVRQFCDAHTCEKGRLLFPSGVQYDKSHAWSYIVMGLMIALLAIYYITVCICYRDVPRGGDLRRTGIRAAPSRYQFQILGVKIGGKKKKII